MGGSEEGNRRDPLNRQANERKEKVMNTIKKENKETTLTRRSMIRGGALGIAAAAVTLPKTSNAQGGRSLVIVVENVVFTPGGPGTDPVNNFVSVGNVTEVDGVPATGKYFCKGVVFLLSTLDPRAPDPLAAAFAEQRFSIDGVGSILGMGSESDSTVDATDDMAVVSGTGHFAGAHGEYTRVSGSPIPFSSDGKLIYEFHIRRG